MTTMRFVGVLPAGDYYIGDPSYLFQHETWLTVAQAYERAAKKNDAVTFRVGKFKCFVSPTNSGDGAYRDQNGGVYLVDTGLIGAIPAGLVTAKHGPRWPGGCTPMHFDSKFKVRADRGRSDQGKRIQVADLIIRT